jgi:biopolymer transport protein ExbB/TolQ
LQWAFSPIRLINFADYADFDGKAASLCVRRSMDLRVASPLAGNAAARTTTSVYVFCASYSISTAYSCRLLRGGKPLMARLAMLLRLPIVWGCAALLGFYALIDLGILQGGLVQRYFASHPIEYVTTALFFVGISALVIKALDVMAQFGRLERVTLGPVPAGGQRPADVDRLMASVAPRQGSRPNGYLSRRLHESLDYVRRKQSAATLDEHLRYLADLDVDRMQSSYSLVRVVIWAVPILGFLGTVVGITLAIAKLSPEALETSLPEVTAGLGVAFDTTALALTLSIMLMFSKLFVERTEAALLAAVDQRATVELVGRFQEFGPSADPHIAAVRRMTEMMVEATETLVTRQAELWRSTLDAAHQQWHQWSEQSGQRFETALTGGIQSGLERHAAALSAAEDALARTNHRHWERIQGALEQTAAAAATQQTELVKQGQVFREIVAATGEVKRLETALNENLTALAGEKHFEDTVMSLAAAIQLLSVRLGDVPAIERQVRLPTGKTATSNAA